MNNRKHKEELWETTTTALNSIEKLTLDSLCHIILKKDDIKCIYESTKYGSNIKYDNYNPCKDVLTDIKNKNADNITINLNSQSLVIRSLWEESTTYSTKVWKNAIKKYSEEHLKFY